MSTTIVLIITITVINISIVNTVITKQFPKGLFSPIFQLTSVYVGLSFSNVFLLAYGADTNFSHLPPLCTPQ